MAAVRASLLAPPSSLAQVLLRPANRSLKGTLHVLRHGFKCYGKTFRLAYFRPNSGMNPDAAASYAANRLTVIIEHFRLYVMHELGGRRAGGDAPVWKRISSSKKGNLPVSRVFK